MSAVLLICGPKAQINNVDLMAHAPINGAKHDWKACSQLAVEYLDRKQFGLRREMMYQGPDCGPVSQRIDEPYNVAVRGEPHATSNRPQMRMSHMNSAVKDADAHRTAHCA